MESRAWVAPADRRQVSGKTRSDGDREANASLTAEPGALYVVATPIGNLADLSERARAILRGVSRIACEDTRSTGVLLARLGISNKLVSYHERNEQASARGLVELLTQGDSVALVSDAGTPCLSDPGFRVVRECRVRGLKVVPVPGASAATALLSVSGLPTNGYLFVGFLVSKKAARQRFFEGHADFPYTIVLYESVHRILKFLGDLVETLGPDREICVGRELTKRFETIHTGKAASVLETIGAGSKKGEFVIAVAPRTFELGEAKP